MNVPFSRRSLLGATAALGAVALPATAPALAGPEAAISPEAAALLREFHGVAGRFNAAGRRLDAAQAETARIPEPDALFVRGDDFWLLGCVVPDRHWSGLRFTYGREGLIAELRTLSFGAHERRRSVRRDEVVGAWDRWQADRAAARDASGETVATERYRAAGDEHDAFLLRLARLRTADPDVMRIKAAAVLNMWGGRVDLFDDAVERVVEGDGDIEDPLCFSLMRDVLHGLGAVYRVTA